MQRASRHDLVRALAPRYGHVSKHEKGQILDQVCEVTGYTRKYALTLLKDPPDEPAVKRTRRRSPSYGPAEVELLRLCWLVTDGICSKRLSSFCRNCWSGCVGVWRCGNSQSRSRHVSQV